MPNKLILITQGLQNIKEEIVKIDRKIEKKQLKKKGLKFSNFDPDDFLFLDMIRETYKNVFTRKDIGDFEYIKDFSSDEMGVYKNDELKIMVLSFKGTTSAGELLQDLYLTVGNLPRKVFRKSLNEIEEVISMNPGYKIILTGHSLGGTKALYLSSKTGYEGVVFNPFIPRIDTLGMSILLNTPNVKKYTIYNDRLSNNMIQLKQTPNLNILFNPGIGTLATHGLLSFYNQ